MTRLIVIMLISLIVAAVTRLVANRVPSLNLVLSPVLSEPVQKTNIQKPFTLSRKGINYQIEPIADYELSGLIVSAHDAKSFWDLSHAGWGDFINTKDICVLWGKNAALNLEKFKFWSGDFTCYFQGSDPQTVSQFNQDQISNNHLIPANDLVAKVIRDAAIGDQISLRGYLANYSINGQPSRRTSLVRHDREDGACETVYVTNFSILSRGNGFWIELSRLSWKIFLASVVLCLGGMVFAILKDTPPPPEFSGPPIQRKPSAPKQPPPVPPPADS